MAKKKEETGSAPSNRYGKPVLSIIKDESNGRWYPQIIRENLDTDDGEMVYNGTSGYTDEQQAREDGLAWARDHGVQVEFE